MPEVKDKMTGKTIAKMPYDTAGQMAAEKMVAENPGYEIKDGSMRSEQMYAGGGMTGINQIGAERPMMMGGGKMDMKYGHGGMTPEMKKYEEGGKAMKPVDAKENPGLSKLPKEVRNKMGYMKEGGKAKTYLEMMRENVEKQKANIKKGVAKQKANIKKGVKKKTKKQDDSYKNQKKFDVDSGIKNQKKFDVDSGVGKAKKPAVKKRSEFQSAFRKARNAGKKTFMHKGKKYNTKLRK